MVQLDLETRGRQPGVELANWTCDHVSYWPRPVGDEEIRSSRKFCYIRLLYSSVIFV